MDHVARFQFSARSNCCSAKRNRPNRVALRLNCGASFAADRSSHSAAELQLVVGRVDDGVCVHLGQIALEDFDSIERSHVRRHLFMVTESEARISRAISMISDSFGERTGHVALEELRGHNEEQPADQCGDRGAGHGVANCGCAELAGVVIVEDADQEWTQPQPDQLRNEIDNGRRERAHPDFYNRMRGRDDRSHVHRRHHRDDREADSAHKQAFREDEKKHTRKREDRTDRRNVNSPANILAPHPIRKISTRERAKQAGSSSYQAEGGADLSGIEVVDSAEEGRGPDAKTELGKGCKAKSDEDQHVAALAEHEAESLAQVLLARLHFLSLRAPAHRLFYGETKQQRYQQAGYSRNQEGIVPAIILVHPAADEKTEEPAKHGSELINRHRAGAFFSWKKIGNHGGRGSRACRFADANAES